MRTTVRSCHSSHQRKIGGTLIFIKYTNIVDTKSRTVLCVSSPDYYLLSISCLLERRGLAQNDFGDCHDVL